jgi:pantetheine-phosphate adenylyltransferase
MKVAICPGSFDPITKGHLDIIHRACKIFDKVIVLVVVNPDKTPSFSTEERIELITKSISDLENVTVDSYGGLLADYAKENNACAIVKGLRAVSDFEYEFQMALANRKLNPNMETVFLNTAAENMYLSSSMVKQIARFGGDISSFIPSEILNDVELRLCKKYPKEV